MFKFYSLHPDTSNGVDKFDEDELLDILEFTCPCEWKIETILQDFKPVVSRLDAFT